MGKYRCIEGCYWGPTPKTRRSYEVGEIYLGDLPISSDGTVHKYFVDAEPKKVEKEAPAKVVAEDSINDMTKRQICTKYNIELSAKDFATTKKAELIAMALGE